MSENAPVINTHRWLTIEQVRNKFLSYMQRKWHAEIQPAPLVPAPWTQTTLFTIAGVSPHMSKFAQCIVDGTKHELGDLLTNSQPCFRANDFWDIWDGRHTTCFEMLGNRSLNKHSKKEQLALRYWFLIEELWLNPDKLYQTVYVDEEGNIDQEVIDAMADIWRKYKVTWQSVADSCLWPWEAWTWTSFDFSATRIFPYGKDKNRWQRGDDDGELWWTCSETFIDTGKPHDLKFWAHCHPNCDCGRFIEIWNSVFMQFVRSWWKWNKTDKTVIDFWWWLERLAFATSLNEEVCNSCQEWIMNVFTSDAFSTNISFLEEKTGKTYAGNTKPFEVICDHAKSISLLMKDGLFPSNTGQWSVLRRLIRNLLKHGVLLWVEYENEQMWNEIVAWLVQNNVLLYENVHPTLSTYKSNIINTINQERKKMITVISNYAKEREVYTGEINEEFVFMLYERHGIPIEYSLEQLALETIIIDQQKLDRLVEDHREKSKKK